MPKLPHLLRLPSKLRRRARRSRMATLALLALLALALFIPPIYIIYKPPTPLIHYFAHRWPDVLWEVALPRQRTTTTTTTTATSASGSSNLLRPVALTIDDAPSEQTRAILDVLRENGARATFFVIGGQVSGREDVLADIVREGHELGNHAMHDEPALGVDIEELERQIRRVEGLIGAAYKAAGRVPVWEESAPALTVAGGSAARGGDGVVTRPGLYFRPGSGFFNDAIRALVSKLGYRLVLGSIYPHDPQIESWWVNAKHILSMLRPGGIIICHDRRSWTAPMLRDVLPKLKAKGYEAMTVTDLLRAAEGT